MGYSKLDYLSFKENEDYWKSQGIMLPNWADNVYDCGGEPICAIDFYSDIFQDDLEDKCLPEDYIQGEYAAIAIERVPRVDNEGHSLMNSKGHELFRGKRYTITKGNMELYDLIDTSENFCMLAPISYAGRTREDKNARYIYALALEVDNIRADGGVEQLFYSWQRVNKRYLKPTYVVCSGNGLHFYFVFERPIPMYANIFMQLKEIKKYLVPCYWNRLTTIMESKAEIQFESLCQPFRVVGTRTKKNSYAMAFKVGDKINIEILNSFLPNELKLNSIYKSKVSLEKAKELYPQWYQRRIVEGKPRGHWHRHQPIYFNWIQKIYEGAEDGHRYNCLENLCSLAVQCQIEPEQVEKDCREVAEFLKTLDKREDNPFTEYDLICALKTYHNPKEQAYRRRIEYINKKTGIELVPNKRNGRKQELHLAGARAIQELNDRFNDTNWRKGNGRPKGSDKSNIIKEWRLKNPDGRKIDCERDLKISRHTVLKWWDFKEE